MELTCSLAYVYIKVYVSFHTYIKSIDRQNTYIPSVFFCFFTFYA
jgi:hypothetical protein